MTEHLIANSGLQFVTTELELNPDEPVLLGNGRPLKYTFLETEDFVTEKKTFQMLLAAANGKLIPVGELRSLDALVKNEDGTESLDERGVQQISKEASTDLFSNFLNGDEGVVGINSLRSLMVRNPDNPSDIRPAFEFFLDRWLPMPMFESESGISETTSVPMGWCRVKITRMGEGEKKGSAKYRMTWAFDTTLATDAEDELRPVMPDNGRSQKNFKLSNRADQLLKFLSTDEDEFYAFSDYLAQLLRLDDKDASYKYIGYYIYFINLIRLQDASPEIILHRGERDIPVDLVIDIGNSRTCGVLFEEGDFTRAKMLSLRDLGNPSVIYDKPFDMRLAFRKADFGEDIPLFEDLFAWRSLVRIGDEAKRLVYRSLEDAGLSERTTNYSSPKRYIWDERPFDGRWEFLATTEDPSHLRNQPNIYVEKLSDMFDSQGKYLPEGTLSQCTDGNTHYSRASLMTFVLIEIFQQALAQINSPEFRTYGNIDCRRHLRNVILTCPTAMPKAEQIRLREYAKAALEAISRVQEMPKVEVLPSVEALRANDAFDAETSDRTWCYDEASCSQLVYLYAEIAKRYNGEIHKFFELKGHRRPEFEEDGYNKNSLTIGTIDIGAGTTDVMVCAYQYEGEGKSRVTPLPLFWDSFYIAGDDILRTIIQNVIIEGEDNGSTTTGNLTSVLRNRLLEMGIDELRAIPSVQNNPIYKSKVEEIARAGSEEDRNLKKRSLCANMVHDFFGSDAANQTYKDRRCRLDFNTQISHPMAQTFMEMLRLERPTRVYGYEDFFPDMKPAPYLLDYFADHFGFRFEELSWEYNHENLSNLIKMTMEPLMRQIAVVLYAMNLDVLMLSGRPTSIKALTELFVKYLPVTPDRLVKFNDYHVGRWFPFADGQGFFFDQKPVVAVGAMVGFLASKEGFNGLALNFAPMIKKMKSTANYIGFLNTTSNKVSRPLLSPEQNAATFEVNVFPTFLGVKQFDAPMYEARPLYSINNTKNKLPLRVSVLRNFHEDKEFLEVQSVMDLEGNECPQALELLQQSLVDDGSYWLDKGEFNLQNAL